MFRAALSIVASNKNKGLFQQKGGPRIWTIFIHIKLKVGKTKLRCLGRAFSVEAVSPCSGVKIGPWSELLLDNGLWPFKGL